MSAAAVELLAARLAAQACGVRGPLPVAAAAAAVVEAVAAGAGPGAVAVHDTDPVLAAVGAAAALAGAGRDVLRPAGPGWRARLPDAAAGVTGAVVAAAEEGVVALACGPGRPRATSLLPPLHVCVLRAADVVPTFADAIARVAGGPLPSALTWVGGPSRTGDLEMVLTLGVHGPTAVEVVLVDG